VLSLVTAALFTGLALVIGAVTYRLGVLSSRSITGDERAVSSAKPAALGAVGGLLVVWAAPLRAAVQAQGLAFPGEPWWPLLRVVLTDTPLGDALSVQVAAGVLATLALVVARRGSALAWWAAALAAVAVAAVPAVSGHAVASAAPARLVAAAWVHVLAMGAWLGTLVHLWRDVRAPHAPRAITAFHPIALTVAAAVVLSGAVQSWTLSGPLEALWRSRWGLLLGLKVLGVLAVMALGHRHWRGATDALARGDARGVQRSMLVEVVLAAVVLGLSAVLTTTPPPE
jgi:putative copper export protein